MDTQKPLTAHVRLTLRKGKSGPIFRVAIITESDIQWRSYDADAMTESEAAIRAARHVPGRRVVWWGRL